MEKIRIKAPAKINLYLEIIGKRKDGYHNICSLVEKVDICDEIEISFFERNCIEFQGPWKIPRVNTVSKTIQKISSLFPEIRKQPVKITVNKNIPPGSGLGGASSDAAGVLKACNKIWKLNLSVEDLVKIGATIGSDVPLFLFDNPCIIEGKGEVVYPLDKLPSLSFNLFIPGIQVSTKSIYKKVKMSKFPDLTQTRSGIKIFVNYWRKKEIDRLGKMLFNRLEEVTLKLYNEIALGKKILEEISGKRFILTGSGGGIYAIGGDFRVQLPEIIRDWLYFNVKSYRKRDQKEEQHGNY
ncbi:MAG: 4-(cytidine 5'-diphospho)-2-C-methyl-D-erythritol kinase [bacterium]|nr:4-(cytidine 5'-diphospho)-2-C-methyl-D-erythritol kinase [bacterium]